METKVELNVYEHRRQHLAGWVPETVVGPMTTAFARARRIACVNQVSGTAFFPVSWRIPRCSFFMDFEHVHSGGVVWAA
jgi:hypothetical protein